MLACSLRQLGGATMDEDFQQQDLRDRQGGRTFRVGQVLRDTFDQRDDGLEPAITRLMLELSRVPEEGVAPVRYPAPARAADVSQPGSPSPGLLIRLAARLRRPRPGSA